jgi:hypothetical protein
MYPRPRKSLEVQLQADLQVTRGVCTGDNPEAAAGEYVRAGIGPLSVVEGIEGFKPKFKTGAFGEPERLEDRHVPVVASRTT